MRLGDYAHNPLVLRSTSDGENVGAVVSSQLFLHLNASLFNRLDANVDVPVALLLWPGSRRPAGSRPRLRPRPLAPEPTGMPPGATDPP